MKFNKLLLGAALVTPLFMGSCNPGTKIKGLTFDASGLIFSTSESTIILDSGKSGAEFIENFSDDYITFNDTNDYLNGKSHTFKKISSGKLAISFTGVSTKAISESIIKAYPIPFTIKKEGFKKGKTEVIEDATGTAYMSTDYLNCSSDPEENHTLIVTCSLTDTIPCTGVSINKDALPISNYGITNFTHDIFTGGTVSASLAENQKDLVLTFEGLTGLTESLTNGHIVIQNKNDFKCFNNLPDDYGFNLSITIKDPGTQDYYFELSNIGGKVYTQYIE